MSLLRRLIAVMTLVLIVGLGVAGVATYVSVRSFLYGRADETLSSSENLAFDYLSFASDKGTHVTDADLARHVSPDVYVLVTDNAGRVVLSRPSGSPSRPDPQPIITAAHRVEQVPDAVEDHFGRYAGTFRPNPNAVIVAGRHDPTAQYRVLAVTVPQGVLYTALSLNPTNDTLASLARIEVVASLAVIVVMGVVSLVVVRRGLRPLRDMALTADSIASGDLTRRVPLEPESTEVGRLGSALNKMLGEIETAFDEKSASEEQLRQFVADASHELRTPLTSIRGYAELLRRGGFSDEAGTGKALQRIEDEAIRMGGLVEDLLLLAELDRGRPLRTDEVDLHRICADVVDDANAMAHGHSLSLVPGDALLVKGDGERLTQVAHNLVRNALAHTPAGCHVVVSTRAEDGRGVLEVVDDGPGISERDLTRIFDRFTQGDPSRTSAGTGLGLAIVRAIAEALHGAASACEAPGGGALLRVAVPLADASPGPVTGATAPPAPPAAAAAARPQRTALSAGGRSPREPATRGPSTT